MKPHLQQRKTPPMKIVNRLPQSDGTVTKIWFDGLNYWMGNPPNLVGPFTSGDLHDHAQQENITDSDSSIVSLDKTTIYPVK